MHKLPTLAFRARTATPHTGGYMGSVRWMAPELMATSVHVGPMADVFSFCTVLWELYSLCTVPFPHLDFSYEVCEAVLRGELPVLPAAAPQWVHDITAKGWRRNPDERPSFTGAQQKPPRLPAASQPPRPKRQKVCRIVLREEPKTDDCHCPHPSPSARSAKKRSRMPTMRELSSTFNKMRSGIRT
mmetsp:Transcript_16068/g.41253  ORF Transcript_16068/g.41253 Transcript_16068/m.41253 type:complete len:186 (+) Transcript_16068:1645-2202(+)